MIERLNLIIDRYNELEKELTLPEVYNDFKKMKELSKEKTSLEKTVEIAKEYFGVLSDIEVAKEMKNDPEMSEFAHAELEELHAKKEKLEEEITILLLPKDPNDDKNVIMEIRGAAGGDEANIFAGDLFRMYSKYAEKMGWKLEITNEIPGEAGGYAGIEFILSGDNVYSKLKYESGSHRVQRVPQTETQGRVHTSTATVLVMPEQEDVEVELLDKDLKIDVCRSSGAGGQCVNTTDSAVRVTHIPTGLMVYCQVERSQIKNKERALTILKSRLYDLKVQEQEKALGADRKAKIGTGDRSEKIRTYNYPQNRLTDHRINFTIMHLDKVMEGNLEEVIEALITADQKLKMGITSEN
ncbi:MAG: peptide chain release factor 1 [Tenericutes bacterium]|nr:peptide chain release factor 1 [Mycoplasmatota bacterium]